MHVALHEPKIPPNTGNIIRLCANTGATLHLIEPLGFDLDDKQLRRAGLDYREWAHIQVHKDVSALLHSLPKSRILAFSTRARMRYDAIEYREDDLLLFGSEIAGLPDKILAGLPPERRIRIPMRPDNRSLNLSNAVAIVVYEAWRQLGFAGASRISQH